MYKCAAYYDESIERGIKYDDPDVGIEWPDDVELIPSERDADAPAAARGRGRAAVHLRGLSQPRGRRPARCM